VGQKNPDTMVFCSSEQQILNFECFKKFEIFRGVIRAPCTGPVCRPLAVPLYEYTFMSTYTPVLSDELYCTVHNPPNTSNFTTYRNLRIMVDIIASKQNCENCTASV